MSYIVDFTDTFSSGSNVLNGFDIVGLDNSENITQSTFSNDAIANGTIRDLMENASNFDFISVETVEEDNEDSFDLDNEAIVDEIESELTEEGEESTLLGDIEENNLFDLEFFDGNGDGNGNNNLTMGDAKITVKGVSETPNISYNETSGTISVDGREVAKIDVSLDLNDDNYDIF